MIDCEPNPHVFVRSSDGPVSHREPEVAAARPDVPSKKHLPRVYSTSSSEDATDDDINDILDEAMNYLEKEENDDQLTPTPSRQESPAGHSGRKRDTPTPTGSAEHSTPASLFTATSHPKPKPRALDSPQVRSLNQPVSERDLSPVNKTEAETEEKLTGCVRKVSSVQVPMEVTMGWLSSLPILVMERGVEERSVQLLQMLADAVEQEEPLLEFQVS